jgi:alpha-1,3-rhamnosyltransferase
MAKLTSEIVGQRIESENPLVSIAIITYNSSEFIIDTLESSKRQSYSNIELVIADDSSTDDTVHICREWLFKNKDRFARTIIVTAERNCGVPANCNRAVKATEGSWVKIIAGDDILHEDCISENIKFCRSNGFVDMIVVSNMIQFNDGYDYKEGKLVAPVDINVLSDTSNSRIQQKYFLRQYFGNTPTLFISKHILTNVPYDESIPFMEDRPFAINATKNGYYFKYLNATTVYYRVSSSSISLAKDPAVLFNDYYIKRRPFVLKYIYPTASKFEIIVTDMEYKRRKIIDKLGLNRNNSICWIINGVTYRLSPYFIFKKLTR